MLKPRNVKRRLRKPRRRAMFLAVWARAPRAVGALFPSSRFLARRIAAQVDVHRPGWVIELGAGTGSVTRALVAAGVKPERLLVVELDRRLCALLKVRFPGLNVVRADAAALDQLLVDSHVHKVNAIVSSLPLLSLPKRVEEEIIGQMFTALPEDGVIVQFTYGPKSPIGNRHLKRNHIKARRAGRVWLNLPPASVWRYERA